MQERKSGSGKMTFADDSTYDGKWNKDLKHGQGVHITRGKDRYSGVFSQGKRQGMGTMIYASEDEYNGEWQSDMPHGVAMFAARQVCHVPAP